MKNIVPIVSAVILVGSLAGSVSAAGGASQDRATEDYCHMKLTAIRPRTLAGNRPQLKSSSSRDVIDYYGACDESPTGADQVIEQKHDEQFRFGRDYEDGD